MTINHKTIKYLIFGVLLCVSIIFAYYKSPRKLEFLGHYDKIWAHRVNSLEKLQSAIPYFSGVELDLVYMKDRHSLDVNHPPSKSINLNFKRYVAALNDDQKPFLWLDIKNLNQENAGLILELLVDIFKKNNYPIHKILVESRVPQALPIFVSAGFLTSYYLPYGLHAMDAAELKKNISTITSILHTQTTIGISSDYRDYDIMTNYFPERKKYVWALSTFHFDFIKVRQLFKDETVQVVLVKFNALRGNR